MELVVLSGKGGTGKTTVVAALSELFEKVLKIDCDVDAANLYLFYNGKNIEHKLFYGEKKAEINYDLCKECGICEKYCRFNAIKDNKINIYKCEGCGTCGIVCPSKAITLKNIKSADTYITKDEKGIISRAEMIPGSEGSGKLIAELRKNAKKYVNKEDVVIVDGSPGIGCSVISSITGCDAALIVTEPTMSAMQDFLRVYKLCGHFGIQSFVCINKYDLNNKVTKDIENFCVENKIEIVGKIPYDDTVIKSINELKSIIYYKDSMANNAIREMYNNIKNVLKLV